MREPLHLIIVSYPSRLDATLEEIAHTLIRGASARRVVERAQEPSDVRFLVRQWHLRDRDVRTLDLIGHGGPGKFKLGDELLFGEGSGLELIDEWRPWLPARATLRLLGCSVAGEEPEGHELLSKVASRLSPGSRVVAPTRALFTIDYAAGGLTSRASRCLKSSTTQGRPHHGSTKSKTSQQPRQAQSHHAAGR